MRTLPGAEKYLASAAERSRKPQTWAEKLIDRANEEVSIYDVLGDFFGIIVPNQGTVSFKSDCPFAAEHPDGGRLDKGWRTYPGSNSSMCFVQHGYMGPVRLVQMQSGIKAVRAAERLLNFYGLSRPMSWRKRFSELAVAAEQRSKVVTAGNPLHAIEALNIALRAEPAYAKRQFDPDVLHAMEVVPDRLDKVLATEDPEAVRAWYDQAKSIMLQIVRRERAAS